MKNYIGEKFNFLTAISEFPRDERKRDNDRYFSWLCDCGKKTNRGLSDIKRGRVTSCGCRHQHPESKNKRKQTFLDNGNTYKKVSAAKQKDPFNYLIKKMSNRKHEMLITISYLKEMWKNQKGRCALTGIKMILFTNDFKKNQTLNSMFQCSVDRIDNSIGYIPGNIRLTTWGANAALNRYTEDQFKEWLQAIKDV